MSCGRCISISNVSLYRLTSPWSPLYKGFTYKQYKYQANKMYCHIKEEEKKDLRKKKITAAFLLPNSEIHNSGLKIQICCGQGPQGSL